MSTVLSTTGLDDVGRLLQGMVDGAREEGEWWVGTIVAYSSFIEFGTSRQPARPYFQPAILELGREMKGVTPRTINLDPRSGRSAWALLVGDEAGLVKRVAFALERRVKEKIKEKGIIDTGNLRSSIVAAPSLPAMRKKSVASLVKPEEIRDDQIDLTS